MLIILPLLGCNKEPITSYKDKVDIFEESLIESMVKDGISDAEELSKDNIPEISIPTHNSLPIPAIYKKHYEELGFDVTKINFVGEQVTINPTPQATNH